MPLVRMEYGTVGQAYVLLARETGSMTMGKMGACLQFTVKEIDPSTGMLALSAQGSGFRIAGRLKPLSVPVCCQRRGDNVRAKNMDRSCLQRPGRSQHETSSRRSPVLRVRSYDVTGEAEEDGYDDEYQLEDIDIGASVYVKASPLPNWRAAWEDTNPESELEDDYGLGVRDTLQVGCCLVAPFVFSLKLLNCVHLILLSESQESRTLACPEGPHDSRCVQALENHCLFKGPAMQPHMWALLVTACLEAL